MKISVTHSTGYRYDFPVYLEPHIFRLRPRMTNEQRLIAFDFQITPRLAGSTDCLDQDGNAWFDAPTGELSVISRFTVEMLRANPFAYTLADASLHLPLWYVDPLCAALTPYQREANVAECVKQFAKSVAAGAQWNTLSFLLALSGQIYQTCRQVAGWYSGGSRSQMEASICLQVPNAA